MTNFFSYATYSRSLLVCRYERLKMVRVCVSANFSMVAYTFICVYGFFIEKWQKKYVSFAIVSVQRVCSRIHHHHWQIETERPMLPTHTDIRHCFRYMGVCMRECLCVIECFPFFLWNNCIFIEQKTVFIRIKYKCVGGMSSCECMAFHLSIYLWKNTWREYNVHIKTKKRK